MYDLGFVTKYVCSIYIGKVYNMLGLCVYNIPVLYAIDVCNTFPESVCSG